MDSLTQGLLLAYSSGHVGHSSPRFVSLSGFAQLPTFYATYLMTSLRNWPHILWPKLFNLSISIPSWISNRCRTQQTSFFVNTDIPVLDVPLPSNFGLHYEDLELETSDGVMLKCFLISQKKDLGAGSSHIEISRKITEEEVSICFHCHSLVSHSPIVYCQSTDCGYVSW